MVTDTRAASMSAAGPSPDRNLPPGLSAPTTKRIIPRSSDAQSICARSAAVICSRSVWRLSWQFWGHNRRGKSTIVHIQRRIHLDFGNLWGFWNGNCRTCQAPIALRSFADAGLNRTQGAKGQAGSVVIRCADMWRRPVDRHLIQGRSQNTGRREALYNRTG